MATEEQKTAAREHKAGLVEDFPDIEAQMSRIAETLHEVMGEFSLKEIIYKSLLVGASITSARYRGAREEGMDFISRVMHKKT